MSLYTESSFSESERNVCSSLKFLFPLPAVLDFDGISYRSSSASQSSMVRHLHALGE